MAQATKFTVRVTPSRRATTISWRATGRFGRLSMARYTHKLINQPIPPTTSHQAFWSAVLTAVQGDLGSSP